MIQVYSAGALVYDSRLSGYGLLALKYTEGLNKAGTATIQMPPEHPSYNAFQPYKPVVEIHEDGELVFRGRPLKPADDNLNRRTITCEGERCFFRDSAMDPYLYQDTPDAIFRALVGIHNSQVEPDKQFTVGTITVTDANDYVRLESDTPEQVSDTLDKLLKRCGGYIVFTTNAAGARVVNWYAKVAYQNNQSIDFGSNLTKFSRATENPDLATRLIPYGAKDETTGQYLTIESVNGGAKYVEDAEAIALRGIIARPVHFDDVTNPTNLKRKAEEQLEANKKLITSLSVTAVDLSKLRKSGALIGIPEAVVATLKAFRCGDLIRVRSKPHQVDEDFLLTDRSVDMLNSAQGTITMGKETATLTGLTTAGGKNSLSEMQRIERNIRADYKLNLAKAITEAEKKLTSLIEQTEEAIRLSVSEEYVTNGALESKSSTLIEQLSDSITFTFNDLRTYVDENDATAREHIAEQSSYIRMENGAIILGRNDAEDAMTLTLENGLIVFKKNGAKFGWWDGVDFHTGNIVIEVNERAQFGSFAAIPRAGGNLSWLKVK
jgi:phage minor structural protein